MLLSANEAAEKLGIKVSQFRRAVERGEMPPPSIRGRPHHWSWDRIESYLKEGPPPIRQSDQSSNDMLERARGRMRKLNENTDRRRKKKASPDPLMDRILGNQKAKTD